MHRLLNVVACLAVVLTAVGLVAVFVSQAQSPPEETSPAPTAQTNTVQADPAQPNTAQAERKNERVVTQRPLSSAPAADPNEQPNQPTPPPPKRYTWDELEAELAKLRAERKSRPAAQGDLEDWYDRLASIEFTASQDLAQHCQKLAEWHKQHPDSATALVALAKAHIAWAWEARGSGFAATVTEEGWQLFAERIAKARDLLEQAQKLGPRDGELYASLITVGMAEGWPLEEAWDVLAEGRALDPTYYGMYVKMAVNLLPRWHGEEGDSERLAEQTTKWLPGDDGLEAYFRIAAAIDCFDRGLVLWGEYRPEKLAAAARVAVERNPTSSYYVNYAALFAWYGNDVTTARKAGALIGGNPDLRAWAVEQRYTNFQRWCAVERRPTGEKYRWHGSLNGIRHLAFSADSRHLWCNTGEGRAPLHRIDIETGKRVAQLVGLGAGAGRFDFNSDQNLLVAADTTTGADGAAVWDIRLPRFPIPFPSEQVCHTVAISPRARRFAMHDGTQVKLIDLEEQKAVRTFEAADQYVNTLVFSRDGSRLAVHARAALSVWDVETGEKLYEIKTHDARPRPAIGLNQPHQFDGENRLIATTLALNGVKALVHYAADGSSHEMLTELSSSNFITVSPDAKLVALSPHNVSPLKPHEIEIWDVAAKQMVRRLDGHATQIYDLAFSHDNKLLATGSTDGEVKIWELHGTPQR
jgi:WD40 repeat protein